MGAILIASDDIIGNAQIPQSEKGNGREVAFRRGNVTHPTSFRERIGKGIVRIAPLAVRIRGHKVVVEWFLLSTAGHIVRLSSTGDVVTSLATGTGFDGPVNALLMAPDGSGDVYAAGEFAKYNSTSSKGLIRLNADGTIDTAFNVGVGFEGAVNSLLDAGDGSGDLLAGGALTQYRGFAANRILRLSNVGVSRTSFVTGTGFDDKVTGLFSGGSDGSLFVTGSFTTYSGLSVGSLIRLQSTGALSDTFNKKIVFDGAINALLTQSDSKLVIGGAFTHVDSARVFRIGRFSSVGVLDETFAKASTP